MSALTDDRIDIFICQIYFVFVNSGFLSIFLYSNTEIDQTAAERFRTFAILTLMSFVDDNGKSAAAELLHILLCKKELLDRTDDDTFLVIDSFCKTAGVFLIINGFNKTDLVFKAVDGFL